MTKRRARGWARVLWVLAAVYMLACLRVLVLAYGCESGSPGFAATGDRVEDLGNGRLSLRGDVERGLEDVVSRALARYEPAALSEITLDSRGGHVLTAGAVRALLQPYDHTKMTVPTGSECHSSCVAVLLATRSHQVADDARVGIHISGFYGASGPVCDAVRKTWVATLPLLHWITRLMIWLRITDVAGDEYYIPTLFAQKHPEVARFTESCDHDPLWTQEGIVLTGADLKAIKAGSLGKTCDELMTEPGRRLR